MHCAAYVRRPRSAAAVSTTGASLRPDPMGPVPLRPAGGGPHFDGALIGTAGAGAGVCACARHIAEPGSSTASAAAHTVVDVQILMQGPRGSN
jgi:hypothetical protein